MNVQGKTLWQVAAGDGSRAYDDICLEYDVMMVGAGYLGPFDEQEYARKGASPADMNITRRFYEDAKRGDVVLFRLGAGRVLAVGEIADERPDYLEEFGDIDGWHLQHVRRVRWFKTEKELPFGVRGRRFTRVHVPAVRGWVEELEIPEEWHQRPLAVMPEESRSLDDRELGRQLFLEGLPSEYIDHLASTLESIRRVATWYWNAEKRPRGRPSESETITYLVVPLLLALGWSHQMAAIEWRGIDVALFQRMPPEESTLTGVVEAKPLNRSVFAPTDQAIGYATQEGRDNCNRLVVTDGIRYTYFKRQGTDFNLQAYLNILRMREKYPVYDPRAETCCGGAVEVIMGIAR